MQQERIGAASLSWFVIGILRRLLYLGELELYASAVTEIATVLAEVDGKIECVSSLHREHVMERKRRLVAVYGCTEKEPVRVKHHVKSCRSRELKVQARDCSLEMETP